MANKGVSTFYVFKSQLQEYAQKVGIPIPVYETIKEGPTHEPKFKSTVIVNDVRYESLPGFFNRKAAEQSAAEAALMRLVNSGSMENLSQPVHETGLCKNLLQGYALKMNFPVPQYECRRYDPEDKVITYSCTVEVGGMRYVGAAARTKKEAKIKAARTALLAVQSSGMEPNDSSAYTVIPMKKVPELAISNQETAAALKPKKCRFKKKKRNVSNASNQVCTGDSPVYMVNQGTESGPAPFAATMGGQVPFNNCSDEDKTTVMVNPNEDGTSNRGINSQCGGVDTTEGNAVVGVGLVTSEVDSSAIVPDTDQGQSANMEAEIC